MVVRKNISMESQHLNKLEPLTKKHGNNLSAAIRDAIDITEAALNRYGGVKEAISNLTDNKKEMSSAEHSIDSGENVLLPSPIFLWMLKWTKGIPLDQEILDELLDPLKITAISDLDEKINRISRESGWNCEISIFTMNDINPKTATVAITGRNELYRDFLAQLVVMFLAYNKNMDIDIVHKRASSLRIDLKSREEKPLPAAARTHFGYLVDVIDEFKSREKFWKDLIEIYRSLHYNMVALPKDHFEDMLSDAIPFDVMIFESMTKKHIASIPHSDFLNLLKKVHESILIVDKIDILENGFNVYHNYKKEKAIQKIRDYYLSLLKKNGHEYEAKYSMSLIIFNHVCCRD